MGGVGYLSSSVYGVSGVLVLETVHQAGGQVDGSGRGVNLAANEVVQVHSLLSLSTLLVGRTRPEPAEQRRFLPLAFLFFPLGRLKLVEDFNASL